MPSSTPATLQVRVGQATRAGRKEKNDDCLGTQIPPEHLIARKGIAAAIADGVSCADGGKVAAELSIQNFLTDYFSTPEAWTVKNSVQRVLEALNRWLYSQSELQGLASHRGFLSTFSGLVICDHSAHFFQVGDSRIYRLREGNLEQITRDNRVQMGESSSQLTRAMGLEMNLQLQHDERSAELNDLYLLTTDGVHDFLSVSEIQQLLETENSLDEIADSLLQHAYEKGSDDNLSALLVRVDSLPPTPLHQVQKHLKHTPFPPVLNVGDQIDGLEIEAIVHESARSHLYRVRDIQSEEIYLLKAPSQKFCDDLNYIEHFIAESWTGLRLDHPHIVTIKPAPNPPSALYYLMDPVDGIALDQWLYSQKQAPSIQTVGTILKQIASALRALHRRQTIYQDLKPDNVMINPETHHITLVDLGSCRVEGLPTASSPIAEGTLDFAAPEQRLNAAEITPRADQFSLALVAYFLLGRGHHPYGKAWQKADTPALLRKLSYIPVSTHQPLVPHWIDRAIERAASIDPSERYPSLSEFIHDIQKPNSRYKPTHHQSLSERNPVLFWQCMSLLLFILALILLIMVLTRS